MRNSNWGLLYEAGFEVSEVPSGLSMMAVYLCPGNIIMVAYPEHSATGCAPDKRSNWIKAPPNDQSIHFIEWRWTSPLCTDHERQEG